MKKYWFKPKTYGYGFVPVTWQGWLATLVLIMIGLLAAYTDGIFHSETMTTEKGFRFFIDIIVLGLLFTVLFKDNVEGGLGWRWGKKK